MIRLSNNHGFTFMAASGALAFDGRGWPWEWPLRWMGLIDPSLFTIVTKTLTRYPRPGNLRWSHPWSVVKKIGPDGILNAIGLTNPGIEWWIRSVLPHIAPDLKIVVSVEAEEEGEMTSSLKLLQEHRTKTVVGVELNLSCPNVKKSTQHISEKIIPLCRSAMECTTLPLIAKLSYTHDYISIVKELDQMGGVGGRAVSPTDFSPGSGFASPGRIDAISINSIPWTILFPDRRSPLSRFGGGGVSGRLIQPYTWKMVSEIAFHCKIPVIAPSIWDYEDIQKVFDRGAGAASFGSVFIPYPWRPTCFAQRWQRDHTPPPR